MNSFVELLLLALFVWRVSSLFVYEDGPYMIFERLRHLVGIHHDSTTNETWCENEFGKLFECIYCISIWIAFITIIAFWISPMIMLWISFPFALSAAACLFQEWTDNDD